MGLFNIGGVPLALSVGILSASFNWKFADWTTGTKAVMVRDEGGVRRVAVVQRPNPTRENEIKRHGVLLGLGALTLLAGGFSARSHLLLLKGALEASAKTSRTMAGIGLAWGGALTICTSVAFEWDHYDDGWKVVITGGSLAGLVAASFL